MILKTCGRKGTNMKEINLQTKKEIIPIFFAVDDRYAPYLCVALNSLKAHASLKYEYDINILIDTLNDESKKAILEMAGDNISIKFVNVQKKLERILSRLHMRDYYTQATYYRFFVPAMFEEYDRGLYLDCDIAITDDVAKLYHCALGDNLVAAVPDEIITDIDVFGRYSEAVLSIPRYEYFNAGILVMNLKEMRRINIEQQFADLLSQRTYRVAQDQDYLNVLCYGKTLLLNKKWNKTPMPDSNIDIIPKIAHYKINFKPWKYDNVPYGYLFWKYAKGTHFYEKLLKDKNGYTEEEKNRDSMQYASLVQLAVKEVNDVEYSTNDLSQNDMILAEA